jgi:hypothetical protein
MVSVTVRSDQEVPVAANETALSEATKALIAKDWRGTAQMMLAGQFFGVRDGTSALVEDRAMFKRRVRITEGPMTGRVGRVLNRLAEVMFTPDGSVSYEAVQLCGVGG